jgi:PAS domain S-box-containing protein
MKTKLRILYLEDDENDVELVRVQLANAGFECDIKTAQNRDEYSSALEESQFDLIFSDFTLPSFDGKTALQLAGEIKPDVPFIFVSGTIGEDVAIEGLLNGATDYVLKQKLTRLVPAVRRALQEVEEKAKGAASGAELRSLFAAMTEVVLVLDKDGRYLQIAPTNPSLLYKPPAELIGKTIHEMLPKPDAENIQRLIQLALEKDHPIRLEYSLVIGGVEIWFDGTVSPFGKEKVIWIARDITERRHAERQLEVAHNQLKYLFDTVDQALFSVDMAQNRMLQASPAHERVFGYPPRDFFKNPQLWYEMILPEDKPSVDAGYPLLMSGKYIQHEFRILRPDGAIRWIQAQINPTLDSAGNLVRIDGVASDITKRKEAADALVQSERRYRTIFEESKDGLFITTVGGKIIDVNATAVRMLGYDSKEEMRTLDIANDIFADPGDRERLLTRLSKDGSVEDFETVEKRKDGQKVQVLLSMTAVRDKDGNISTFRGLFRDVTKQRQLEQQLIQAQKLEGLGTLAGGIAHDFNNILAIIMGHASMLGRYQENAREQIDKSADGIIKASERGAGLVRQLLTFARKTERLLEPVNVNGVIQELAKLLEETFPKSITISLSLGEGLPVIMGDGNQLHQVFLNLCVNARDAMPEGGTLAIGTSLVPGDTVHQEFVSADAGQYICAMVRDTGSGMDQATRLRIFEPFFTTKEVGKGTGLGLAVVYGIVTSLNGYVGVKSSVGKGTTFELFFPVLTYDYSAYQAAELQPAEVRGGSETILLVEDEEMLLDLLTTVLETKGYTVLRATDGEEALKVYRDHWNSIDLVISDIGLPKRDGVNTFLKMKEINPDVKAIIASGYTSPEQHSALYEAGVIKTIAKPYVPDQILKCVREALEGSRSRD